jgi:acetolactate synthase-1/3 small subunit
MLPGTSSQHHILSVLVENKAGVLTRVASLFARRGYNIFSLAVSPTEDPKMSRMTIVVDVETAPLDQIVKQLDKLINVVSISELAPAAAVERELMLVTVRADAGSRGEVLELVTIYEGRIVDVGAESLTLMLAGTPAQLDDATDLLNAYGISGIQRTGRIALPRVGRSASRLRSVS